MSFNLIKRCISKYDNGFFVRSGTSKRRKHFKPLPQNSILEPLRAFAKKIQMSIPVFLYCSPFREGAGVISARSFVMGDGFARSIVNAACAVYAGNFSIINFVPSQLKLFLSSDLPFLSRDRKA